MRKHFIIILVLILHGFLISEETPTDYQVISGAIYNISKYTTWPGPLDMSKPFIIGVIGKLPRGEQIYLSRDAAIDKRRVIVKYYSSLEEIKSPEVLFIASSEAHRLDEILKYIEGKPILTIGDTKGFAQKGVIINFYVKGIRECFEVNYDAYRRSGIQIHSNVLVASGRLIGSKNSQAQETPRMEKREI